MWATKSCMGREVTNEISLTRRVITPNLVRSNGFEHVGLERHRKFAPPGFRFHWWGGLKNLPSHNQLIMTNSVTLYQIV